MFSWFTKKFSRKMAFAFCLVILFSMTFAGFLLTRAVKNQWIDDLTSSLHVQASLIASQVNQLPWTKKDSQKLHELTRVYSKASGCRVTFIDPQGAVLGDSGLPFEDLSKVENHKDRPEVVAALKGRKGWSIRHSETVGLDLLYAALPVRTQPIGIVRIAMPLTRVREKLGQIRSTIFWITLGMILVSTLVVLALARSLANPVQEMSQVARRLSLGEYQARVCVLPRDEHGELGRTLNLLAEKVQRTVQELSQDKAKLSLILSSMVEAVVAVDAQKKVLAANAAFSRLFSIKEEEALGKPFYQILRQTKLAVILECALGECRRCSEEVLLFAPEQRIFEANSLPLLENGKAAGALLVLHDITPIRKLEQVRKDFVANVSHELRTPLASIKGSAETLLEGALGDARHGREFTQAIADDVDRLTRIVDDLLNLSAVESGKRQPQRNPLSLLQLAQDAAGKLKGLAAKNHVAVEIRSARGLPQVLADREQLSQVFVNLIENAIKFNRENGRVVVSAATDGTSVTVSVQDTGSGIPSKDLPRIFERFYRVDKARSRELGGTGLGLSIVKHIVEAHGGSVHVESVEGEGSAFHFSIPIPDSQRLEGC